MKIEIVSMHDLTELADELEKLTGIAARIVGTQTDIFMVWTTHCVRLQQRVEIVVEGDAFPVLRITDSNGEVVVD